MSRRGVNMVVIVGHVGTDPEVRYTPSGSAVANMSVATSEGWKDKQTGEMQERTEWHRVVFYNRLAEIAGEYVRKGSKVYINGSIRTNKWQDKTGADRYTTEIIANEMQMLDKKGEIDMQNIPQQSNRSNAPSEKPAAAPASTESFDDDDIPF